jgi:hypothetical protein
MGKGTDGREGTVSIRALGGTASIDGGIASGIGLVLSIISSSSVTKEEDSAGKFDDLGFSCSAAMTI